MHTANYGGRSNAWLQLSEKTNKQKSEQINLLIGCFLLQVTLSCNITSMEIDIRNH